jgi:3-hydroxybutyryl-CoA dehydrogenase
MTITIGVCGAGTMGYGIAQLAAQSGFETILYDVNEEALQIAEKKIKENLEFLRQTNKINSAESDIISQRISFTSDIEDCFAQVIIEAIVENATAKIDLFKKLAAFNNDDTILASNTSSISITEIQKEILFPERVAGMHFFNPPYIMKLVEVVKGEIHNEEIIKAITNICRQLGRVPVICQDSPGFIVNRIARHYYLESLKIAEDGIASVEDIDAILEATGFKMGPFKLMDMIGMDINLAVSEIIYSAFDNTERFRPSELQKQKVKDGELGKKTGKGFYEYS